MLRSIWGSLRVGSKAELHNFLREFPGVKSIKRWLDRPALSSRKVEQSVDETNDEVCLFANPLDKAESHRV